MPWARFEDRFQEHPKVRKAWRAAPASVGLHVMAVTYCSGNLTDGYVPAAWVESQFRRERDEKTAVAALVDAGLWDVADDGWTIHDYLDYQPSKASVVAKRQRNAENGRKGGEAKAKRASSDSPDDRQEPASDLSKPRTRTRSLPLSPDGETTDAGAPAAVVVAVIDQLRKDPEWAAALLTGGPGAVEALVESNADAPWTELAAEAVASKLDPTAGSIHTRSPRQGLELRLADHRSGRRGGDGQVTTHRGGVTDVVDHYAAMRGTL